MKQICNILARLRSQFEPLMHLAITNLKVQYRRPLFGFLWAFLMPVFTAIIFTIVFSFILRFEVEEYPFFVYLITAIFPWNFFQNAVTGGTTSMLDNRPLVSEASISREIIPLSVIFSHLINFLPTVLVVIVMCLVFRIGVSPFLPLLPFVIALHTAFIAGFVLCTSCLYVRFRDLKYIVEIICMAIFYLTPVFYALSLVQRYLQETLFQLYMLNPLVGILNLYRLCFLPRFLETLPEGSSLFSIAVVPIIGTIGMFMIGLVVFNKYKRSVYDDILA